MTTINELLAPYWDFLQDEKKLRPATCTAYVGDLRALSRYLEHKPVESIIRDDLRAYQKHLSKQGKAVGTIRRQLHGFGTFWQWLELEQQLCNANATRGLIMPRRRRKQPKYMSEDELRAFMTTPAESARAGLAWGLFAWLGLRFREVFFLRAADVKLDSREIIIRESKGDDRTLPMPDALYDALRAAVSGLQDDQRVFDGWGKDAIYRAFYAHLEHCGLDGQGFTPRSLRHSFVTHRLERGVPIHTVKDLAGHKRIDTTATYAHANAAGKRAAIEDSPLAEVTK